MCFYLKIEAQLVRLPLSSLSSRLQYQQLRLSSSYFILDIGVYTYTAEPWGTKCVSAYAPRRDLEPKKRSNHKKINRGNKPSGTVFRSFFLPDQIPETNKRKPSTLLIKMFWASTFFVAILPIFVLGDKFLKPVINANPDTMMKIVYFDCRGVIETSRCMLKIAGVPFEDHRMSMVQKEGGGWETPEFTAMKGTSALDANMNRAPVLHVDGAVIGQSKTIDRFVAKRCNMMGVTDIEAAQIDCIAEHIRDIKDKHQKVKSLPAADKEAGLKKFFASDLGDLLVLLEKSLPATRKPGYAVGSATSYADVSLWCFAVEHFDDSAAVTAAMEKCEGLKTIVATVAELPNLKAWLAVRPASAF